MLNNLRKRNGRWYYLSAMANMGLGNNLTALQNIQEAVRLEPDNMQYKMLLNRLQGGDTQWYRQQQNPYGGMDFGDGDFCMKLCMANLACNLCCGGRICCI